MRTEFSSEKEKHNYFNRMTQEQKLDAMAAYRISAAKTASTERERRASPNTNRNICSAMTAFTKSRKSSFPTIEKTWMPAGQSPMPPIINWRNWSALACWRA